MGLGLNLWSWQRLSLFDEKYLWFYMKGHIHGKTVHVGTVNKSIAHAPGSWCNASFAEASHRLCCCAFNTSDGEYTELITRNAIFYLSLIVSVILLISNISEMSFVVLFMFWNLVSCLSRHQFAHHRFKTKWTAYLVIFSYHRYVQMFIYDA